MKRHGHGEAPVARSLVGGMFGFRGGMSLDKQLGSPLGSSGGFLNIGHLTSLLPVDNVQVKPMVLFALP